MIKKIVCAALMLALLATSSMGAFAAVTATSTYKDGVFTVTSTVDDVAVGDTITYLAYDAGVAGTDDPADGNIAYIDQIEVKTGDSNLSGSVYTISYVTDPKYVGAKVLQGGIGVSLANTVIAGYEEYCAVTVTVDGIAKAPVNVVKQSASAEGFIEIPCADVIPATVEIAGVSDLVWLDTADGFKIPAKLCAADTLAITVTSAVSDATQIVTDKLGKDAEGKMVVGNVNGKSDDFGVLMVSTEAESVQEKSEAELEEIIIVDQTAVVPSVDADYAATTLYKYQAGAKGNDGSYMIKVIGAFEGSYYVRAYAKVDGAYIYGDVETLKISE